MISGKQGRNLAYDITQIDPEKNVIKKLTPQADLEKAISTAERFYELEGFGVQVVDVATGNVVYTRRKDIDYLGLNNASRS